MVFEAPMELRCDGVTFGTIARYDYEFPWAQGQLVAADPARAALHSRVADYERWISEADDDLSDDDLDAELARRGLSEAELQDSDNAEWTIIVPGEGEQTPRSLTFLDDDWITWRW
jgi:hypothetical protein